MTSPLRTDEPIVLPTPAAPVRRGSLPVVASFVPVIGAVAMWLVTGYVMMLCFAAIGPLMAVASLVDGARGRRRERRRSAREMAEACKRARGELRARHDTEREGLARRKPDAGRLAEARTLWRHGAGQLVIGRGRVPSETRVTGGDGDEAERLRRDAAWVEGAPVTVSLAEAGGVCVQGSTLVAHAVARALLMQLCLRASPDQLVVTGMLPGDREALAALPHLVAPGARSAASTTAARDVFAGAEPVRVAVTGGSPPAGEAADFLIAVTGRGEPAPPACGVLLELDAEGGLAARRLDDVASDPAGEPIAVEALSAAQAGRIAADLAARRGAAAGAVPSACALADLLDERTADEPAPGLSAPIGRSGAGTASVDLVGDGPHAVVVGITGSGKSELLTTWISSLAATRSTDEVAFLLADFKGGTAFSALERVPHVTGLLTDLDGTGARRAVESLRAELRRREAAIAGAGAADIADPRVDMPRLVIVVDEFAALLQDHGDLHAVFTDVAARGRALGMHLVLGTQRAAGVLRDALLANCPLRICLRVADAADSRAIVGSDEAARLPGDAGSRGLALVRRGGDSEAETVRIARTGDALREELAAAERPARGPRAPWLPPLPERIALDRLEGSAGAVLLGVADEPEHQRQPVLELVPGTDRGLAVVGGAGSGKTEAVRLIAGQVPGALIVPGDLEAAWGAVEDAARALPPLVAIDDLDVLFARYPMEYAHEFAARVEALVRDAAAAGATVVLTASRVTGTVDRLLGALPRRALLRLASRADHVQAGGDGAAYDASRVPGRAVVAGREVQFALADPTAEIGLPDVAERVWEPGAAPTAIVTHAAAGRAAALAETWGRGVRVVALDALDPATPLADLADGAPRLVVVGDGESWLRHRALLRRIRADGELLVAAECASELRTVAGERALPPFARTRAGRAWRVGAARGPERVVLPA